MSQSFVVEVEWIWIWLPTAPVIVNLPFVLNVFASVKARVLPPVMEVRLKNVMAGVPEPSKVDVPAPSTVTVPLFGVNPPPPVLLSVKLPARLMPKVEDAENIPLVDRVRLPFISKIKVPPLLLSKVIFWVPESPMVNVPSTVMVLLLPVGLIVRADAP